MSKPYMTYTQHDDGPHFAGAPRFATLDPERITGELLDLNMSVSFRGLTGNTKVTAEQIAYAMVRFNFDRHEAARFLDISTDAVAKRAWSLGLPVRDLRTGVLMGTDERRYSYITGAEKYVVPENEAYSFLER